MGLDDAGAIGIGVVVGILSTSVQSLGLTLQRKSHLLEDDRPAHVGKRPPHRRRRWQIGMLLFIVSNILGSSIQITTLPLVILSPLQASGLVFNSICATLILAEPFTRYSLVGTILVCAGATLIAAFGAMKEPAHTLDELLDLLGKTPFLLWMVGTALAVGGILAAAKASSILWPRQRHTARMRVARGVAYGCVSGILSAHCLLLAKSAVELLVRTVADRVNQFNRWQSWVILLGLLILALTQLFYLHRGLKLCSTSILYPLVFCVYNIIAILDGLLYYRQASKLSALHGCLIALGTVILLSGVFALSWRLQDEPTKPPVNAPGALAPGLGFGDSDTEESHTESEYQSDEEPDTTLIHGRQDHKIRSPTHQRRASLSELEEIWGQLQDEDTPSMPRLSGLLGDTEAVVNENSTLLGSGGGRWRTRTASFPFPRVSSGQYDRRKRPRIQEAMGGWWKMKWWKRTNGTGGSYRAGDIGGVGRIAGEDASYGSADSVNYG